MAKLKIRIIDSSPEWIEHVKDELKGKCKIVYNDPDLTLISDTWLNIEHPKPFVVFTNDPSVTLKAYQSGALACHLREYTPGFVMSIIESAKGRL